MRDGNLYWVIALKETYAQISDYRYKIKSSFHAQRIKIHDKKMAELYKHKSVIKVHLGKLFKFQIDACKDIISAFRVIASAGKCCANKVLGLISA